MDKKVEIYDSSVYNTSESNHKSKKTFSLVVLIVCMVVMLAVGLIGGYVVSANTSTDSVSLVKSGNESVSSDKYNKLVDAYNELENKYNYLYSRAYVDETLLGVWYRKVANIPLDSNKVTGFDKHRETLSDLFELESYKDSKAYSNSESADAYRIDDDRKLEVSWSDSDEVELFLDKSIDIYDSMHENYEE